MQGAGHEGGGGAAVTPRRQKFFKVLLPGSSFASSLSLPPKFAARLDIPPGFAIATLRDPAGRSWHVDLDPRRLCFTGTGWRCFLAGTGASAGCLLVFEHLGALQFAVEPFDASGCSLDIRQDVDSTASRSLRDDDADMESHTNNRLSPTAPMYTPVTKKRNRSPATASAAGSCGRPSPEGADDDEKLGRLIIERPSHLQYVYLTKALCDRVGWTTSRTAELTVAGGSERRWEVAVKVSGKGGGMLMAGWAGFAQDNGLRVSDVCVFRPLLLGDTGDQLVQVQLIRGL